MQPHAGQHVATLGRPLGQGSAVMILVHGRGAGSSDILDLGQALHHAEFTYLAPAASESTWYPNSFMAEIEANEPGISSGLHVLDGLVEQAVASGVEREHIVIGGFSQGACLACEYAVRHAQRFGGILAFSGGLIGPPGTRWPYAGDFAGTPVFLGCSDVDAHIPKARVDESAVVFERMGAKVEKRIYPGMGHTINDDELVYARSVVEGVLA